MRTIALVIVLFCTSGMICGQSRSAAIINPSRRVPFFAVKQRNLIDALLSFGGQEYIPIGIEYIDKAAQQGRLGRAATAVDDGERSRVRTLEGAGVRQDGCRIQPGTTSPGLGSANPLEVNWRKIAIALIDPNEGF
jgi:hypothetical protein